MAIRPRRASAIRSASLNIASLSKNKHKARAAKNLLSRVGEPRVNVRTRVHSRAFPRINSNKKISQGLSRAFLNPRPVAERGANTRPGDSAEKRENGSPGTPLWERRPPGTPTDGLAPVKEPSAGLRAAAGGGVRAGPCTAMRMRTRPGAWRRSSQERCGRVRANEITLSRVARCSGRGRA